MRDWNIPFQPGHKLTLAADARFCTPDPKNDQIWELCWNESDTEGLNIQTTYGLRVQNIRFFPQFIFKGKRVASPASFFSPLILHTFTPNYALFSCFPYPDLEVQLEYWVPESQAVSGRISLFNRSTESQDIAVEWVGILNPLTSGQSMMVYPLGPGHVLTGRSGMLHPVCYLTGSPSPARSTMPALCVQLELEALQSRRLTWVVASLDSIEQSFDLARSLTARQWDAEIVRLVMQNIRHSIEINTGNPDWDFALALSQKEAFSLYHRQINNNSMPAIVLNRLPDHGFSVRGDGRDLDSHWSSVTPLDLHYWLQLILPGAPEVGASVIESILESITDKGFVDLYQGAGAQVSQLLTQPLLVTLCRLISQTDSGTQLHYKYYSSLIKFLKNWFSVTHDRDQDGLPEWDHPVQSVAASSSLYDKKFLQSPAYSIAFSESSALAAMLYRESCLLKEIAQQQGFEADAQWLDEKCKTITKGCKQFVDELTENLRYIDFQTHLSPAGIRFGALTGNGILNCRRELSMPGRPEVNVRLNKGEQSTIHVTITGKSPKGMEIAVKLGKDEFVWYQGRGKAIAASVFSFIDSFQINGAGEADRIQFSSVDYSAEDISSYLVLWAKLLTPAQAKKQIETNLLPGYIREFGAPLTSPNNILPDGIQDFTCHLPLVTLVGQGLINYEKQVEAAELLTRIMNAIVLQLKQKLQFAETYDSESGQASGKPNSLSGLAPIGFFLQVLGIRSLGDSSVELAGNNPFPWPVTVKYRGMTITRKKNETDILFLSGDSTTVQGPGPHRISLR